MREGSGWTALRRFGVVTTVLNGQLETLCPKALGLILYKLTEINNSTDYKYAALAAVCDEGAVLVDIRKSPRKYPPPEKYIRKTLDESPLPFIQGRTKGRQALNWVKPTRTALTDGPLDEEKGRANADNGTVDTDKEQVNTGKGIVDVEIGLGGEGFETIESHN
jgi:hypothetical protein